MARTMRKILTPVLVVVLALPAIAAQVWEKKSPEQWSKKEVEKILTDSPWAKRTVVPYSPLESGEGLESSTKIVSIGNPRAGDPSRDIDPDPATKAVFQPDRVFFVRWASAKILRQAREREAALASHPAATSHRYKPAADEIFIEVSGTPLDPLPPASEVRLKENSHLLVGRDKWKVEPLRVHVRWPVGGGVPEAFEFYFSRRTQTGRELVREDETVVEFSGQVGPRVFGIKFDPSRMRTREGLDF